MSLFVSFTDFGKAFIPRSIRPRLRRYLLKAGYTEIPYHLYGVFFIFSVLATGFLYASYIFPNLSDVSSVMFMILTFVSWVLLQGLILILIIVLIYVHVDVKIYKRTREMEEVLEEFLRYVSENLKGGMSFEKALWEAIRPEYGTLADEVRLVAKRVITGTDISDALVDFTDKYDSPMLRRSFQLIVEGMKGGGNIAYIIDRVEKNIRETKELKEEMVASNTTYVIFMTAIVLIIAPGLFGLSYNLLLVLQSIAEKIAISGGSAGGMAGLGDISDLSIDPSSFRMFSIGALGVIALFSSMILSIIQKGNVKGGLKYIPIFMAVSIIMYYIFRTVLGLVFSGMISI